VLALYSVGHQVITWLSINFDLTASSKTLSKCHQNK